MFDVGAQVYMPLGVSLGVPRYFCPVVILVLGGTFPVVLFCIYSFSINKLGAVPTLFVLKSRKYLFYVLLRQSILLVCQR